MRRLRSILIMIIMILSLTTVAFADNGTIGKTTDFNSKIEIHTVRDAENILIEYFKASNIDIQIGSEAYIEYLTNLLMFEDESLAKLSQYEDIKIYASEYLSQLNNPEATERNNNGVVLNIQEQNKTIEKIKQEAIEEDILSILPVFDESDLLNIGTVGTMASYSDSKAVSYARKWAKSKNPQYKYYSNGDCTNFVSQCVAAGGKSMRKPSSIPTGVKNTTDYWYSVRYDEWHTNNYVHRWNESTSFIRVSDFYTYWKKHGITSASYSTKAKLQNGANIGDVVQLKNGNGKWFHSIIITGGSKGARTYCGHTTARLDAPVKNISGAVSYRALKF